MREMSVFLGFICLHKLYIAYIYIYIIGLYWNFMLFSMGCLLELLMGFQGWDVVDVLQMIRNGKVGHLEIAG